jgi:hypothetical protein
MTIARTFLIASLFILGCGDDDAAPAGPSCVGTGCACDGAACMCVAGDDCSVDCHDDACGLVCSMDAKCNVQSDLAVTLVCSDTSECKGNGGDGSMITCENDSNCDLKAGAMSTAVCRDTSDCKINLGPDSTISCEDTARCDLKCDAGCIVTCAASADCSVSCGPGDSGVAGMTCPDGRIICGGGC